MPESRSIGGIIEDDQTQFPSRTPSLPSIWNLHSSSRIGSPVTPQFSSSILRPHQPISRNTFDGDTTISDSEGSQGSKKGLIRRSGENFDSASSSRNEEVFDLSQTLRKVVQEREKHGVKSRRLGIAFKDLQVVGIGASASYAPSMASILNPFSIFLEIQKLLHPRVRDILSGFEGVVKPGEMLLVLGRPGSGSTTLLKTLANRRKEYHAVRGDIHYDSIPPRELQSDFRGDVQYCPEDDIHFPTLTVEQTLRFASTMRAPRYRSGASRSEYVDRMTDILTTVFGLQHIRKTPVGDHTLRGVSGGEKKRVSLAEGLTARSCIGAWDNPTRGLDASTALEFILALRTMTDTFHSTNIMAIYQAGEQLYTLFDKVCVIYEGEMVYFGPTDQARQYFIDMGYEPANRQTTADFLVAVTDPAGRISRPAVSPPPQTATEFAEYFKKSELGALNRQGIEDYIAEFVGKPERANAYRESARQEIAKGANERSAYILNIPQQIKAVVTRRIQILRGNMLYTAINLFSFVFQAVITGSVFVSVDDDTGDFFSRGGVIFFALLFSTLSALSEIPALYSQRPIIHRHEQSALYHPFVEAVALTLVDIPITLGIIIIFSIILYFMTGLQRSADQYLIFLLFLSVVTLAMKSWFRSLAALFPTDASAQSVAGVSVLVIIIYIGYAIPKPSIVKAMRWITYINPVRYGFESLMSNEFRSIQATCSDLVPHGPGYENITIHNQACTTVGSLPAQAIVDGSRFLKFSFRYSYSHTWMNFGIIMAYGIGFTILLLIFTEYLSSSTHESSVVLFRRSYRSIPHKTDEEARMANEKGLLPESNRRPGKEVVSPPRLTTDIFSWKHLQYTVLVSGGDERKLLDDISGFVAPGKLTALMGESGAGKTTLLNVLAQRTTTGIVSGDRFVNGHPLPRDFQAQTGYVQQMDIHVPECTIREALLFSAKLRQPPSVPLTEKEAYVETCLRMCGLQDYADAIIGSLGVEHRKRTTIAVELAAKPKLLLFLDEPTSGLDSQSAWSLISFLRSLADNGQAILCTIHQPSAELFQVFDRLLLLKKGGQTVYFGDLGHNATTLIEYFEKNGARPCRPGENPAEYMLEVIGAGATATTEFDWHAIWKNSREVISVENEINNLHAEGRNKPAVVATIHSQYATSWFYQTWELIKRSYTAFWRNPTYLMAKLALNIIGGLFIGFTFFQSPNSQQGTQNKIFAIFMTVTLSVPLSGQLMVPYIEKRTVYEAREKPSRIYRWSAFNTAHALVEILWNVIGSHFVFFTWYWTVGFPTNRAGYTYLMLAIVFPVYYSTIALAVAAASPNAEIGNLLFSTLFSFVITFCGVVQPFNKLGWWKWMYRISPFTYLIEGVLGHAVGRQSIECASIEYVQLTPPTGMTCSQFLNPFISSFGGYLTNPNATADCNFCNISSSDTFLSSRFNIFYHHAWRNFVFMIVFVIFNTAMIYITYYLVWICKGNLFSAFGKMEKKCRSL